jgi:outer membrane protein TolC
VAVRESAERPTVTANAGYTRTNHVLPFSVPSPSGIPLLVYPDVPNNYSTRLEMRWPIYTGGRTDALERAARAEAEAVGAERQTAQADLRLEVTRAYWALVTARASLDVLEQGVARSQAHVNDANQRFMAGLVPPNEVSSAAAQEARSRMLAIEARTQRDVTGAELARLIGVEPDQLIEPTADLGRTAASPNQPLDVAPLVESARAARQERRVLQQRIAAADAQREAAAAGRLPTVQFLGGVDYARPNPKIFPRADVAQDSWDVGVGATWSLWDGGRTVAEVVQAKAVSQAATERLAEFDSQLSVEVRQRALELEAAMASVAAATSGVTAAADARRVVDERYRAGVIGGIEVLDAEYALLQAQLDLTRAQAGVRLAEAQLTRALGR